MSEYKRKAFSETLDSLWCTGNPQLSLENSFDGSPLCSIKNTHTLTNTVCAVAVCRYFTGGKVGQGLIDLFLEQRTLKMADFKTY